MQQSFFAFLELHLLFHFSRSEVLVVGLQLIIDKPAIYLLFAKEDSF